jgi:AmmeMemoRadiSam system protein B
MRPLSENATVRPPAVAGFFYPGDAAELRTSVSDYLEGASAQALPGTPKALIVPHAGYIYSAAVAAAAYVLIAPQRNSIKRAVLVGPSHRVYFHGVAVPEADRFQTPLGEVSIDEQSRRLTSVANVIRADQPHAMEHSLEVQLPFLQALLPQFELVPMVTGVASAELVAAVLDRVWGEEDTLVIASSDLSHYHDYATAQRIDAATSAAILSYNTDLTGEQACGATPINGLLHIARERGLGIKEIARCNSGDTAGDRNRVVGYGAYALYQS